jgi:hypothetical protein
LERFRPKSWQASPRPISGSRRVYWVSMEEDPGAQRHEYLRPTRDAVRSCVRRTGPEVWRWEGQTAASVSASGPGASNREEERGPFGPRIREVNLMHRIGDPSAFQRDNAYRKTLGIASRFPEVPMETWAVIAHRTCTRRCPSPPERASYPASPIVDRGRPRTRVALGIHPALAAQQGNSPCESHQHRH